MITQQAHIFVYRYMHVQAGVKHSGATALSNSQSINEHLLHTHAHLLHASLNLPSYGIGMELWNSI